MFEKIGGSVISTCYSDNSSSTTEQLLVDPVPEFGDSSIIQIAADSNCLTFLSHAACQDACTRIWFGAIEPHANTFKVYD